MSIVGSEGAGVMGEEKPVLLDPVDVLAVCALASLGIGAHPQSITNDQLHAWIRVMRSCDGGHFPEELRAVLTAVEAAMKAAGAT
jgi:hypothetical protein